MAEGFWLVAAIIVLVLAWVFLPAVWDHQPFMILSDHGVSLNTLAYAAVFAIAAIGLNRQRNLTDRCKFNRIRQKIDQDLLQKAELTVHPTATGRGLYAQ